MQAITRTSATVQVISTDKTNENGILYENYEIMQMKYNDHEIQGYVGWKPFQCGPIYLKVVTVSKATSLQDMIKKKLKLFQMIIRKIVFLYSSLPS